MITSFILLGLFFVVIGVLNLCGRAFMLGARRRALLERLNDEDKRRYLFLSGLVSLICGLLWTVLGLLYPLNYTLRAYIFVIIGVVTAFAVMAENKKFFGRFM